MVDDHMNRDRQFKDSKVLGTPDYIAPEVILGQPYGETLHYANRICQLLILWGAMMEWPSVYIVMYTYIMLSSSFCLIVYLVSL